MRKRNRTAMNAVTKVDKRIPSAPLNKCVAEYVLRAMQVDHAQPVVKAMPLRSVSSIDFFLGDPYETICCETDEQVPFVRCTIRGPRTHRKYSIRIGGGDFIVFSIRLQPAGLYGILGIPASEFTDQAIDAALIDSPLGPELIDQLAGCTDIDQCIRIIEPCLLKSMQQNEHRVRRSAGVEQLAALLRSSPVPPSITPLQQQFSLSLRQLERNFMKEIGVTPKLYSRMLRFTNVLQYKKRRPGSSWASLAYEFDYADQMHLIKEFRSFLGVNPSAFVTEDFAF